MTPTADDIFALIQRGLGPEAHRHRGIDAPARRDTAIAGGSYRAPGTLVDGIRAGDGDTPVTGIVVTARASTPVLRRARDRGANLVISRQAFLGDSQDRPVGKPEPALAEKLDLIAKSGLIVLRLQDPRTGPVGRAITAALPAALGLGRPDPTANPADGLVCHTPRRTVLSLVRAIRAALPAPSLRLVGNPALLVQGVAFATETSRPNALAPLLARNDVNLLVAGEVHETETTAYVLDAITLGLPKALLLVGSIALEDPPARALTQWLARQVSVPVYHEPSPELLTAF